MSKRLCNPLWLHFTQPSPGKAKCLHCDQIVSRGSNTGKSRNTTNIWRHLEVRHMELYHEAKKMKDEVATKGFSEEQILAMQLSRPPQSSTWKDNDPRTKKVNKLMIEMCATDDLPFSVVSGEGFKRLMVALEPKYSLKSEIFYRSDHLEVVYKKVQTAIRILLSTNLQETCLSFTVDCCPGVEESLFSLTGHFINEQWERQRVMLHVKAMTEDSTEHYIQQFFLLMLKYWSIKQRRVHLLLRDKGADVSDEQKLKEVPGLRCSAQVLQSLVEEGISSQRDVEDVIDKVRACFGHFQDSILAKQHMRAIQNELNVPQNDIDQDEPTRWTSTLQMLRDAQEQRRALNSYALKYGAISALTDEDWDLIQGIIETLLPIEEVTREMSDTGSLISCVIPSVSVLKMFLQKENAATRGTATMQQTMLRGLEQTYAKLEDSKTLVLATLLDPRYKCNLLSSETLNITPQWLSEEYAVWRVKQEEDGEDDEKLEDRPDDESAPVEEEEEKPTRDNMVEQMFAHLLGSRPVLVDHQSPELSGQLEQYLNEPLLNRKHGDPLSWWRGNSARFNLLAPLARKLLSAPPASVPPERQFARGAERGSRASGEHAEKLYFLKHNLPLIKYDY